MGVADRVLLFLMRMRRGVPFEGLRIMFGVSYGTAYACFMECLKAFHDDVVPRLLHPLSADQIDAMSPENIKRDLPGAKLIFDLTAFPWKAKENVLLSRILYSAYHHRHEGGAVFGECTQDYLCFELCVCVLTSSLQLLHPVVCSFIGPNFLVVCPLKF